MLRTSFVLLAISGALLSGCGGSRMDASQMTAARPTIMVDAPIGSSDAAYRIGVGDKLAVRVFQVPDLSFDELVVDTSGNIQMPLIGSVQGAGRTSTELSSDIAARLATRFLRNPQVTVSVAEAASQKITVDGAVAKPGVYEMRGSTSLLQAVAMAQGPSAVADLSKVAVFRTIDGQRSVALFDLAAIREGRFPDPQVYGDDIVVVDTSRLSVFLREVVAALPGLSIFRPYN